MGRNDLKGRHGDRINPILAAAGYNFRFIGLTRRRWRHGPYLLPNWIGILWLFLLAALFGPSKHPPPAPS